MRLSARSDPLVIERDFLYGIQGTAIAKKHAEVADAIAETASEDLASFRGERVPGRRLFGLMPAGQSFRHAINNVSLKSCRFRGGSWSRAFSGVGFFSMSSVRAARDEFCG